MPNLKDITPDQRFVGLFVGESGTGKTCAAVSFPGPVHNMDFDGRIRGAYDLPFLPMEGISYEYFSPRDRGLVTRVNNYLEGLMTAASVGQWLPRTLIMDSLTSECFAMVMQAIGLTHQQGDSKKGKYLGTLAMPGPEDYGFEANATYSIMSFLRSLPIQNIIVTAHVVPIWGKQDPDNPYSNSIQVGERLSVRDKIGANVGIYFDHVFRFRKKMINDNVIHTVQFRSDIARTAYSRLPDGEIDITGKNFYNEVLMSYMKKEVEDVVSVND